LRYSWLLGLSSSMISSHCFPAIRWNIISSERMLSVFLTSQIPQHILSQHCYSLVMIVIFHLVMWLLSDFPCIHKGEDISDVSFCFIYPQCVLGPQILFVQVCNKEMHSYILFCISLGNLFSFVVLISAIIAFFLSSCFFLLMFSL
jgi:hypothetical protein